MTLADELEALRSDAEDSGLVAGRKMQLRAAFVHKHFDAIVSALSTDRAPGDVEKLVERIAQAVMVWGAPHFKHMVSFNTLQEAIEPHVSATILSLQKQVEEREEALERETILQNKRVNDAIQTALERGELLISSEGWLVALSSSDPITPEPEIARVVEAEREAGFFTDVTERTYAGIPLDEIARSNYHPGDDV